VHGRQFPGLLRRQLRNQVIAWITDLFIAVSDDMKNSIILYEKVPERKLVTIFNGIVPFTVTDTEKQKYRKELGLTLDDFVIGTVGRLVHVKNQGILINAFKSKRLANFKLVIVGEGNLMSRLQQQTKSLKISQQVIFTGNRLDAKKLMATFDIFILPSKHEGISLTLLEAMNNKLPIIASAVGGNIEVIVDSETGLLVLPNDSLELSKAIQTLHNNIIERERFRQSCWERFNRLFTIDIMTKKYLQIYESIMENK